MSDTPVAPLPPSYDWGFVVGRSISAIADTIEDSDRFPEARGSNGRVTFTPLTRFKKELSAPTAFVQFEVITAKIVNGNIVDAQGEEGIYLISGAYKVAFTIDSGSIPGFDILVTPDHTLENPLDLVTVSPYVPEDGTPVVNALIPAGAGENQVIAWRNGRLVWVNGAVQAEAAADRAEAAATAAEEWAPDFTWSGTNLVIDGVSGPDLKGEKGDGSSWDELTGKPATLEYDSGERDITSLLPDVVSGRVLVWRLGRTVHLTFDSLIVTVPDTPHWLTISGLLPLGFRGANRSRYYQFAQQINTYASGPVRIDSGGTVVIYNAKQGSGETRVIQGTVAFPTPLTLPTTLPGTPA